MKILLPTDSVQCLKVRARVKDVLVTVSLRDEMKDETYRLSPSTGRFNGDWTELDISHDFKEGENYEAEVKNGGGDIIWRGKIFVTGRTDLQNYSVNYG